MNQDYFALSGNFSGSPGFLDQHMMHPSEPMPQENGSGGAEEVPRMAPFPTSNSPLSSDSQGSPPDGLEDNPNKRRKDHRKLSEDEIYQRRKAQNRAAQRAFRERKEGKLRELRTKLDAVESEKRDLQQQLAEVKQKNAILDMENRFLQKNKPVPGKAVAVAPISANGAASQPNSFVFPDFTKEKFIEGSVDNSKNQWPSLRELQLNSDTYQVENTSLLTVGAVWDYLVDFAKMNGQLEIDIPGIMNDLRGKEVCHGFGPAYPLDLVNSTLRNHLPQ